MAAPPPLFDPALRQRRRDRARRSGFADFLHAEAAAQISERLQEVNRSFPERRIVTHAADVWQGSGVASQVVPDDDILQIEERSLDLIVHGLCLHSANDPVGQLVQCRRALKPDGLMIAVLFGGQTLNELRSCLAEAETRIRGGLSPRVHPMGEIRDLGALLQRSGFALPVADSFSLKVAYRTPLHLMGDLRAMGESNCLAQQDRGFLRRDVLEEASRIYLREFSDADGRIEATFEFVFLTGWAPAEGQQQPLRPGSAQARLSDFLGVPEMPAGEKARGKRSD